MIVYRASPPEVEPLAPPGRVIANTRVRLLALIADDERSHRTMVKRIVLDVDMPIMNGVEALRVIRSSEKHRQVPIVFVRSLFNPDAVRQLVALGVSDYPLKPIRVDQAIARLGQAVRDAKRRRWQSSGGSIERSD